MWQYTVVMKLLSWILQETTDKLQDMRFQLQLSKTEDQKTPIQQTQENLR